MRARAASRCFVPVARAAEKIETRSHIVDALYREQFADLLKPDFSVAARDDGANTFADDPAALRPHLLGDAQSRKELR